METSDLSWRDSLGNSVKTVKAEDDYLQFESRFTIIEDAAESIFHPPEEMEPDAKCSNCGRPARYVQRATGLRATMIEEGASYDRVKSEYKTFNLNLCRECAPSSVYSLNRWEYPIIILFIAAVLWLAWMAFSYESYLKSLDAGEIGITEEMNFPEVGFHTALTIMLLFFIYLLYKIRRPSSRIRKYIRTNETFLWQIRDDGWLPIFSQNLVYYSKIKTVADYLESLVNHHPTLCCLFPGELGHLKKFENMREKLYEFNPEIVKEPAKSISECKCSICSETATENIEMTVFREVCTTLPDNWEGVGHDYACVKVPVCLKCSKLYKDQLDDQEDFEDRSDEPPITEVIFPPEATNRDWMILYRPPGDAILLSKRFKQWLNENSKEFQVPDGPGFQPIPA